MSTEKSPSVGFNLGEFLFFLILLPSYVLWNGVFAKTRGRIKDIYGRKGFWPFALGLIGNGGLIIWLSEEQAVLVRPYGPTLTIIGFWLLVVGLCFFAFKLFLVGVHQIAKAAKTGASTAATSAPTTSQDDDIKVRLQRLEELREAGLVSEEEYLTKREAILGEI